MILDAKNENIQINGWDCDYISFGSGKEVLIMLPGVGDGFKTAKGLALPFSLMYRSLASCFKVYVFSRRNRMPVDFTTKDMADDISKIMEKNKDITCFDWYGNYYWRNCSSCEKSI